MKKKFKSGDWVRFKGYKHVNSFIGILKEWGGIDRVVERHLFGRVGVIPSVLSFNFDGTLVAFADLGVMLEPISKKEKLKILQDLPWKK